MTAVTAQPGDTNLAIITGILRHPDDRHRHPRLVGDEQNFAVHLARAVAALTPAQKAAGRNWWAKAMADVRLLADTYGVEYERLAYVVAVLSPGLRWSKNLAVARLLLEARAAGSATYPRGGDTTFGYGGRAKAWEILHGGINDLCHGQKVEALAANLLGDADQVMVDRHIVRAATGTEIPQLGTTMTERIANHVRLLAAIHGMRPADLQAALWLVGSEA